VIQAGSLDAGLGGVLGALQAEHPSLRIDVEGAEMNDVFRALGRRSEAGR
jgi:hypothetical protein